MIRSLFLAALMACGGEPPAPAADAPSAPAAAPTLATAAADAVGCKDLDDYARAVEAYATEYAKLDLANPGSAPGLTEKALAIHRTQMELARNPVVYTPACAPRWQELSERMAKVSTTMNAKADALAGQQSAVGACLEGCRKGAGEAMDTCVAACMKMP
jgi:hypothetical protein